MTPWPDDVTMEGEHVVLRPTRMEDAPALAEAVRDGELWKLWYTRVPPPERIVEDIETRLALRAAGRALSFTVLDRATQVPVGMTAYVAIDSGGPRLEIGRTWYRRTVQRTGLNTECKLMLLTHAFEELACIAVEFRTHAFNHASRESLERLGAKQDGILRNHGRGPDGVMRDTVVYSILPSEWPAIRHDLRWRLGRQR